MASGLLASISQFEGKNFLWHRLMVLFAIVRLLTVSDQKSQTMCYLL